MEQRFSRISGIVRMAAVVGTLCAALSAAAAPAPPPLPPGKAHSFPRATRKPPVPKVFRLAPGQTKVTAAQLKSAPTVDEANRRATRMADKPAQQRQIGIPGTPRIIRGLPLPNTPHTTTPKPVAKPKTSPVKPKTAARKG